MLPADELADLLRRVAHGNISPEEAQHRIAGFSALPHAYVDHDRPARCGAAEVIFAQGKTREQVVEIAQEILRHAPRVLITRAGKACRQILREHWPDAQIDDLARTAIMGEQPGASRPDSANVLILTAGTSDLPVAQEASQTLKYLGIMNKVLPDVGVAGLHRLLGQQEELKDADVAIVVAGMEGALPSVVGGLTRIPIIAVPTSVGYGASFGGISALLGMLNTCASGVTLVNIDNGFGAAYAAARILWRKQPPKERS